MGICVGSARLQCKCLAFGGITQREDPTRGGLHCGVISIYIGLYLTVMVSMSQSDVKGSPFSNLIIIRLISCYN